MEPTKAIHRQIYYSDKIKMFLVDVISYIFIMLFIYTASDKLLNIGVFISFMKKLDLISGIGAYLAWMVPTVEIMLSIILLFNSTRLMGLWGSLSLMILFTSYLIYMKLTAEKLPCHCGGVISNLRWDQHIWLNTLLILIAATAISAKLKSKQKNK